MGWSRDAIRVLEELVRIPSINPPGTDPEIAYYISRFFESKGFSPRLIEVDMEGITMYNVIVESGRGRPALIFNGHHDVVPPGEGWETDPFKPVVKDGFMYGRGTADMKSGLASMMVAFVKAAEEPIEGKLIFAAVADEEGDSSHGTKYLLERGILRGDYAIVGESTNFNIVIARKGVIWLRIVARGVSAHAHSPGRGVNAITRMARIIDAISTLSFPESHELLGEVTITPTMIRGGVNVNIVPDSCTLTLDVRTIPNIGEQRILSAIGERIGELGVEHEIRVDTVVPSHEVDRDSLLVRKVVEAVEKVRGSRPKLIGRRGSSDAVFFSANGIPAVDIGPRGRDSHSSHENVELETVPLIAEVYREIALRILSG